MQPFAGEAGGRDVRRPGAPRGRPAARGPRRARAARGCSRSSASASSPARCSSARGARRDAFATGDAITVAAGLAVAGAVAGEIRLGERRTGSSRRTWTAEPLEPVSRARSRGAGTRLATARGCARASGCRSARRGIPLIDRKPHLAALRTALARVRRRERLSAAHRRRAGRDRQVPSRTRAGRPGRGDEATVAVGRCLSYGDGITYRPLAEILQRLPGGDPAAGSPRSSRATSRRT